MKRNISVFDERAALVKGAPDKDILAKERKAMRKERDIVASTLSSLTADFDKLRGDWRAGHVVDADFISGVKALEIRLKDHVDRKKSLHDRYDAHIAAQRKYSAHLRSELADKFDLMHGLVSYVVTNGQATSAMRFLHSELGDFKAAKSDKERDAIAGTIRKVLDSDELTPPAALMPSILSDFSRIDDPEQRSQFYREHREALHAAFNQEAQIESINENSSNP